MKYKAVHFELIALALLDSIRNLESVLLAFINKNTPSPLKFKIYIKIQVLYIRHFGTGSNKLQFKEYYQERHLAR